MRPAAKRQKIGGSVRLPSACAGVAAQAPPPSTGCEAVGERPQQAAGQLLGCVACKVKSGAGEWNPRDGLWYCKACQDDVGESEDIELPSPRPAQIATRRQHRPKRSAVVVPAHALNSRGESAGVKASDAAKGSPVDAECRATSADCSADTSDGVRKCEACQIPGEPLCETAIPSSTCPRIGAKRGRPPNRKAVAEAKARDAAKEFPIDAKCGETSAGCAADQGDGMRNCNACQSEVEPLREAAIPISTPPLTGAKRGRPPKKEAAIPISTPPPTGAKRGRPPKNSEAAIHISTPPPTGAKRGRPPKNSEASIPISTPPPTGAKRGRPPKKSEASIPISTPPPTGAKRGRPPKRKAVPEEQPLYFAKVQDLEPEEGSLRPSSSSPSASGHCPTRKSSKDRMVPEEQPPLYIAKVQDLGPEDGSVHQSSSSPSASGHRPARKDRLVRFPENRKVPEEQPPLYIAKVQDFGPEDGSVHQSSWSPSASGHRPARKNSKDRLVPEGQPPLYIAKVQDFGPEEDSARQSSWSPSASSHSPARENSKDRLAPEEQPLYIAKVADVSPENGNACQSSCSLSASGHSPMRKCSKARPCLPVRPKRARQKQVIQAPTSPSSEPRARRRSFVAAQAPACRTSAIPVLRAESQADHSAREPRSRFPHVPWAEHMCKVLRSSLQQTMRNGGLARRPLRLGTDCAGAEAPYFALQEISAALSDQIGAVLNVDHMFSCDVMRASREFVIRNTSSWALFPDLLGRTGVSHCLLADRLRVVPRNLDIYVAGFPCKDFSMLNQQRPCMDGPNVSIFHGVVNYIKTNEPCAFILENVVGLTVRRNGQAAPIQEVMKTLRSIPHYEVRGWKVNTADFQLPQNRFRIYIVGVHMKKTKIRCSMARWKDLLQLLKSRPQHVAQDFMLDDWQKEVQRVARHLQLKKNHWTGVKYLAKHRECRVQLGLPATGARSTPLTGGKERGWTHYLSALMRDTLELSAAYLLRSLGADATSPDETGYLSEISRGINYSQRKKDLTPCLTPSGRIWVFSRWRWLIGVEKMALQGFPVDRLDFTDLSEAEICTLAGNAMSVPVVGAFLYLVLASVEFPAD